MDPEIQANTCRLFCQIWEIFMPVCHRPSKVHTATEFLCRFLESIWQMEKKKCYINLGKKLHDKFTNLWGVITYTKDVLLFTPSEKRSSSEVGFFLELCNNQSIAKKLVIFLEVWAESTFIYFIFRIRTRLYMKWRRHWATFGVFEQCTISSQSRNGLFIFTSRTKVQKLQRASERNTCQIAIESDEKKNKMPIFSGNN